MVNEQVIYFLVAICITIWIWPSECLECDDCLWKLGEGASTDGNLNEYEDFIYLSPPPRRFVLPRLTR